jgi:hypothetical protein
METGLFVTKPVRYFFWVDGSSALKQLILTEHSYSQKMYYGPLPMAELAYFR